ncbi:MAG: hypothetical protein ACE5I5_09370 [Candidatus Heimdallarchaeota archaeon]
MAGYEKIGYILGFFGGILMIIIPILDFLSTASLHIGAIERYIGLISGNEILVVVVQIIIAIIILGVIGTGPLRLSKEPNEILVGILLIILGVIGGTIGGILAIIGGIFYILESATK